MSSGRGRSLCAHAAPLTYWLIEFEQSNEVKVEALDEVKLQTRNLDGREETSRQIEIISLRKAAAPSTKPIRASRSRGTA